MEILHHLDKRKIDITRLILKIEDSNFTCKPNFNSRKNHILATRSKDHFLRLKYDIFKKILWVHLFRGPVGGVKIKIQQNFCFSICSTWFQEKSKNFRVLAVTVHEQSQNSACSCIRLAMLKSLLAQLATMFPLLELHKSCILIILIILIILMHDNDAGFMMHDGISLLISEL